MIKRALTLLAVTVLTATSSGCNCCPCLRNLCPWWSAPAAVPAYAAVPSACPPAPVYAAVPQQYTVPQYAAPQYAMPAAQPVYSEAGCGAPYAAPCTTCAPLVTEMGCGMPYTAADPGCGYIDSGYSVPSQPVMVDPGPAP